MSCMTEKQLQELHKDIEHGISMIVEKNHYYEIEAELALHRWIPASEGLPEIGSRIHTLWESGNIIEMPRFKIMESGVTHWRYIVLPKTKA